MKGPTTFPLCQKEAGSFRSFGGGAQLPTEILGQFANGHRLKAGMPQDPLLTLNDDPWAGWG